MSEQHDEINVDKNPDGVVYHCIVKGCPNASDEGEFIAKCLCKPCYEMLKSGGIEHGQTFIHKLMGRLTIIDDDNKKLRAQLKQAQRVEPAKAEDEDVFPDTDIVSISGNLGGKPVTLRPLTDTGRRVARIAGTILGAKKFTGGIAVYVNNREWQTISFEDLKMMAGSLLSQAPDKIKPTQTKRLKAKKPVKANKPKRRK